MGHVFVSYSHKDTKYAHKLADDLLSKGVDVWIDERLDYGSQWPQEIQKQLDSCDAFILVMTPNSFASDWVQSELQRAKRKQKPIFPLLLEGDEPWLSVESTQYYDVRGEGLPDAKFYSALKRVVIVNPKAETFTRLPKSTAPAARAQLTDKRNLQLAGIGGMLLFLLACVMVGGFLLFRTINQKPPTSVATEPNTSAGQPTADEIVTTPSVETRVAETILPTATDVLPTFTSVPITPTPAANFSGEWWTNFSKMNLQQTGNLVTGTYVHYGDNVPLEIRGTIDGSILRGTNFAFEFRLSAGEDSFDGWWDDANHYRWCGVRSGPLPDGCGFSGTWIVGGQTWSNDSTIRLIQTGPVVQGSYLADSTNNAQGSITGNVKEYGYVMDGSWSAGGGGGPIYFKFVNALWNQFQGYFQYPGDSNEYSTCGWRNGAGMPVCP